MEFTHRRFPAEAIPMGAVVTASGTGAADPAGQRPGAPPPGQRHSLWQEVFSYA